jgi:murein DD-endopeptidase MepM/ murein hydrolase activator NlpD
VINIDFKFIREQEGGSFVDGYVKGASAGETGVFIATGFDLGARDEKGLKGLNLPADLVKKLQPYLGKVRADALDFLKDNPLKITKQEAGLIDDAWMSHVVDSLVASYDNAVKAKGGKTDFGDLVPEVQTVIASMAFQHGDLAKERAQFWELIVVHDFYGAVHDLRNFKDAQRERRNAEADLLLRGLDKLKTSTATPALGSLPAPPKDWFEAALGKDDTRCFPLAKGLPKQSWEKGGVSFGANRGGRAHAASDLIAPVGTIIYAVADGTVLHDPYGFYLETDALEINHGTFTVRYGEIAKGSAKLKAGTKVTKGQPIAKVGKLKGSTSSMLHFEMYRGEGDVKAPLTVRDPKKSIKRSKDGISFQRRSDLVDCTPFLNAWQKNRPG